MDLCSVCLSGPLLKLPMLVDMMQPVRLQGGGEHTPLCRRTRTGLVPQPCSGCTSTLEPKQKTTKTINWAITVNSGTEQSFHDKQLVKAALTTPTEHFQAAKGKTEVHKQKKTLYRSWIPNAGEDGKSLVWHIYYQTAPKIFCIQSLECSSCHPTLSRTVALPTGILLNTPTAPPAPCSPGGGAGEQNP